MEKMVHLVKAADFTKLQIYTSIMLLDIIHRLVFN